MIMSVGAIVLALSVTIRVSRGGLVSSLIDLKKTSSGYPVPRSIAS